MGRQPYSDDLRSRVVAAVAEGCSRRAAGKRFAVSASSSIRWVELQRETGSVSPRPRGGKSRSPLELHATWLLDLVDKAVPMAYHGPIWSDIERAMIVMALSQNLPALRHRGYVS